MLKDVTAIDESGFTLIEVVASFAILAISLGVLYESYSIALKNSQMTERVRTATLLAQSKLAEVGTAVSITAGVTSGSFPNSAYDWVLNIQLAEDIGMNSDTMPAILYDVTVTVGWDTKVQSRKVMVKTLKLSASQVQKGQFAP